MREGGRNITSETDFQSNVHSICFSAYSYTVECAAHLSQVNHTRLCCWASQARSAVSKLPKINQMHNLFMPNTKEMDSPMRMGTRSGSESLEATANVCSLSLSLHFTHCTLTRHALSRLARAKQLCCEKYTLALSGVSDMPEFLLQGSLVHECDRWVHET
ncbi:hypothetical protein BaRGS_00012269 [Batillaria attramentaria]|uniref:Uncharacterized protein n=1 Tax=Batillaria attramentaria TaxID=370345 RepID=A0ABD0LCA7_9CAEN